MKHLVIGYKGEVGSALFEIIEESKQEVIGIDRDVIYHNNLVNAYNFDFIHICINNSPLFITTVMEYIKKYALETTIIIIHTTVKPGTTDLIIHEFDNVVYSPVRGKHPTLKGDLRKYTKYFSHRRRVILAKVGLMYSSLSIPNLGLREGPLSLEIAKPVNTTYFGYMLAFFQDLAIMTKQDKRINLETIIRFIASTDERFVPPYIEAIGGHCIISNLELLDDFRNASRSAWFVKKVNNLMFEFFADKKITLRDEK